ncbi:MAG: DUF459 domain-containing protein [Acidimicrobiia bacterium]|nr:DUF459 domain-containing protein [Acidimicrobiia bacterium]
MNSADQPATARFPAPDPLTTTYRFDSFRTFLGTLFFLVLATFLSSASLVDIATRMEFGPDRDRWLSAALVVDEASHTLYMDRPGDWIRSLVDYEDGPGVKGPDEGVILGELARTDDQVGPDSLSIPLSDVAGAGNSGNSTQVEPATGQNPPQPAETEPLPPTTPEPPVPSLRAITQDDPLRIWLGGDSLGQYMAAHIAYRIAPPERTEIDIDYHISTGLARPDYFDWPARLSEVISQDSPPEALVYMVGGNDDQAMRLQSVVLDVSTPEWLEEYRRRVGLVMDVTAYADTRLIWVLLPPMEKQRREGISNQINEIVTSQAELRPWVSVLPIDDLLLNDKGEYSRFVDDPNGEQQLARQPDGVHITEIGSRWVADRLWDEITSHWPTVDALSAVPTNPEQDPVSVSPEE